MSDERVTVELLAGAQPIRHGQGWGFVAVAVGEKARLAGVFVVPNRLVAQQVARRLGLELPGTVPAARAPRRGAGVVDLRADDDPDGYREVRP
ncbi:MAG: hypothetical protein AB7V23_12970 [Candidatus Nanopelagicales bacterium]